MHEVYFLGDTSVHHDQISENLQSLLLLLIIVITDELILRLHKMKN